MKNVVNKDPLLPCFFLPGVRALVQEVEGVQPHHRRAGRPAGPAQGVARPTAPTAGGGRSQVPKQRQPRRPQLTRGKLGKSGWSVDKWSTGKGVVSVYAGQFHCVKDSKQVESGHCSVRRVTVRPAFKVHGLKIVHTECVNSLVSRFRQKLL